MTPPLDAPLDLAHRAMEAAPDDDAARLRFYERLADAEMFLLLAEEAEGDDVRPRIFPVEGSRFVLVFDREDRLAEFADGPAPYAALPGRVVAGLLAGQGIGMGVNLGVAPSSILIDAEAVDWLAATLSHGPSEIEARPLEITPPHGIPERVLGALDTKLGLAAGLARFAWLCGVRYADGRQGHLLAFVAAVPGAEAALTRAVAEALTFSGVEAGEIDVAFFDLSDPIAARLASVGLRFDLPEPAEEKAEIITPAAPGMDPAKPPRLR